MHARTGKAQIRNRRQQIVRLLHRYGGLAAAALILLISTTGMLLNHSETLGLSKLRVRWNWVLDWYGIATPVVSTYSVNGRYVSHAGQRLYLDGTPVDGQYARLHGAVSAEGLLAVSADNRLLLFQADGMLVEAIDPVHGLPLAIKQIGKLENAVIVATEGELWQADPALSAWRQISGDAALIDWSRPTHLPDKLQAALLSARRGDGLSLERVILDLHSGRIAGLAGAWLGDLIALLLIGLALSGLWMWLQTRQR